LSKPKITMNTPIYESIFSQKQKLNVNAPEFIPRNDLDIIHVFSQKQKLNVNAPEFYPRKDLDTIHENEIFNKLEQRFVEQNKWIFKYDPLADVVVNEQRKKRKFEEAEDSNVGRDMFIR